MANITPRKNKDGVITSYTIRVYHGYDGAGKRLKPYTYEVRIQALVPFCNLQQTAILRCFSDFNLLSALVQNGAQKYKWRTNSAQKTHTFEQVFE